MTATKVRRTELAHGFSLLRHHANAQIAKALVSIPCWLCQTKVGRQTASGVLKRAMFVKLSPFQAAARQHWRSRLPHCVVSVCRQAVSDNLRRAVAVSRQFVTHFGSVPISLGVGLGCLKSKAWWAKRG